MIDKLTDEDKIEIIYNSLSKIEEISFTDKREKINFNPYMLYLNFLESQGKIKIKMIENCSKREWKIIVEKLYNQGFFLFWIKIFILFLFLRYN